MRNVKIQIHHLILGAFIMVLCSSPNLSIGQVRDGQIYVVQARHSVKVWDVKDNSKNDHTVIQQWTRHNGANQQFRFKSAGDGTYFIENINSGKYLDIPNGSKESGVIVQQYPYHGGPNQRFQVKSVAGGFVSIMNKHSEKWLDIVAISPADGAQLQQFVYNGGENQQFKLIPFSPSPPIPTYRVRFELVYNKTTDISDPINVIGTLNTEDEVFFGVNSTTVFNGVSTNQNYTMRPIAGRDIYEMGPNSNKSFNFSLFNGSIKPKEMVAFGLAIIEQDNEQRPSILQLSGALGLATGAVVATLIGEMELGAQLAQKAKTEIEEGLKKLYESFDKQTQQLIGDVAITVANKGNGPQLVVKAQNNSGVSTSTPNMVELVLSGAKSNYTLRVYLEKTTVLFKSNYIFLDAFYDDKCRCGNVYVINRGSNRLDSNLKEIPISTGGEPYRWYCCDGPNSANPPDWTNLIMASYQNQKNITWKWYHKQGEAPIVKR